jgi:signal recognition particle subunit SRP54
MTIQERKNPDLINGSRRKRIALVSGREIQEVNQLMKQFEETRKMMRMMGDKNNMARMMKNLPFMKK